ncbi:MAG: 1-acyl-sn-glycerol-3-phosphate acyltransferase [Planctomycetes bacterium]|nr:1-acyl-sn-glycerol-3-phosphate acyltransferase [Planctomycetota bacterium]
MNRIARTAYGSLVFSIKAYQFLFHNLRVWGRQNIPAGPKIYITNHITTHDSFWVLPVFTEPVHVVIGPAYESPFMARVLNRFEQIDASVANRQRVVEEAVKYLEKGEAVYMAPEGDIQEPFQLGRFYPGFARMYRRTLAPIVPVAVLAPKSDMTRLPFKTVIKGRVYTTLTVLRGTYCINIGKALTPEIPEGTPQEQDEYIVDVVRREMESLVAQIRVDRFWL